MLLSRVLLIIILDFIMRTFRTRWFIFRKQDLR